MKKKDKPVDLKALTHNERVAGMVRELEAKPAARSERGSWTQVFAASGKIGKPV